MSDEPSDFDERFDQLKQRQEELNDRCYRRSSVRLANEAKRLAKSERKLIPYLRASFSVMVDSVSLLEPNVGRDIAVELIGLLESPDQARHIQADFPEAEYEFTIHWMSSCAYDNLADNTAELSGYNSDGMHQCINDGIQICRRTGKTQCVTCFREYASQVYAAADDIDMAMHFARMGMNAVKQDNNDRRWVGTRTLCDLQMISGDLQSAAATMQRAVELIPTYHTPLDATYRTLLLKKELELLSTGQSNATDVMPELPPRDEYPMIYLRADRAEAVAACVRGDTATAVKLLSSWDAELRSRKMLDEWFRTRLRLLCALKLAGDTKKMQALADALLGPAEQARDWLTLRLLKRILDPAVPAAPIPLLNDPTIGPYARASVSSPKQPSPDETANQTATAANESAGSADNGPPEELQLLLREMFTAMQEVSEENNNLAAFEKVRDQVVELSEQQPADCRRDQWLLYIVSMLPITLMDRAAIWSWTSQIAGRNEQDAVCMNLRATIGGTLLEGEDVTDFLSRDEVILFYKLSLIRDPNRCTNFDRAGHFHLSIGDEAEAERCFARAFRLDRTLSRSALPLAEIYNRTDRGRDALAVLDLCLREGTDDPQVAWTAALTAFEQQDFTATLTYLDRYEQDIPQNPWQYYYRAIAELKLNRYEEAGAAAVKLVETEPAFQAAAGILSATAAILAAEHVDEEAASELSSIIALPCEEIGYLTTNGASRLFELLWNAFRSADNGGEWLRSLEARITASGWWTQEMLQSDRDNGDPSSDLTYYVCTIRQSMPQAWLKSGLAPLEMRGWQSAIYSYGVLAESESSAVESATALHQRAALADEGTVLECNEIDQGFRDSPGIVWQGVQEESV